MFPPRVSSLAVGAVASRRGKELHASADVNIPIRVVNVYVNLHDRFSVGRRPASATLVQNAAVARIVRVRVFGKVWWFLHIANIIVGVLIVFVRALFCT